MTTDASPSPHVELRSPDEVMRLSQLGASHQTRLSFLRALLRRAIAENWRFERPRFDIDQRGVGTAIYTVDTGPHIYSLIAYGHDLPAEKRTDRVIAEEWDSTFALFDGVPTEADVERLRAHVPRQEVGRYHASELVLARANRSVRLFDHVVSALADGRQPDPALVRTTGYLMRTTAVYGNGKFGIADRDVFGERSALSGPFRAEMLAVYLIRAFTADLVEHMASVRSPATAVRMAPSLRRRVGIGNATGLGMAPFLVKHPSLINRWYTARETALQRVRSLEVATPAAQAVFKDRLERSPSLIDEWTTDDAIQAARIRTLSRDVERLTDAVSAGALDRTNPWEKLYRFAERSLSPEGLSWTVSLMIEPYGALVDDLADAMSADEKSTFRIDGTLRCGALREAMVRHYGWALELDFADTDETSRFWYVSEEKLEPRLGERSTETGQELEQPLATARDAQALYEALRDRPDHSLLAEFLLACPEHRHTVRRVQIAVRSPYGEIRDNLIGAAMRPVDILRSKLAFFGAMRFDPKSDKWLRITLYQGAPFPHEIGDGDWDDWIWGAGH